MKNTPNQISNNPIDRIIGLIQQINNNPNIIDKDIKQVLLEISNCFIFIRNEIEEIQNIQRRL
ncbi:MAG: hypothetical protein HZB41_07330 [Ignavibacteriae bacterium]|nr:hypothetical protein [Ignavibacteriota bacterium]